MQTLSIHITALYLAAGAFWWRRIVLPGPTLDEPEEWRVDLAHSAQRGDVALLMAKGRFLVLWPIVLALGWVTTRIG